MLFPLVAGEVRQGCAGEEEEAAGQRGQGHPWLFDGGKKPVIYVHPVIAGSPTPLFVSYLSLVAKWYLGNSAPVVWIWR